MKFSLVLCSLSVASATQLPSWTKFFLWKAPKAQDVRGPCPMLNTLANHGFLPRDGRNFDLQTTVGALKDALNFDEQLSKFLHDRALMTNPQPNATTWSLETLRAHNVLEHDASFTRADYYFKNDSHSFDQATYEETKAYWTGPTINMKMAAEARLGRLQTSNATNPTFELSDLAFNFGVGETAAYIVVVGDKTTATVPRSWVQYLFEKERLPLELGWRRPKSPFTLSDLRAAMDQVLEATPGSENAKRVIDERNIHGWA